MLVFRQLIGNYQHKAITQVSLLTFVIDPDSDLSFGEMDTRDTFNKLADEASKLYVSEDAYAPCVLTPVYQNTEEALRLIYEDDSVRLAQLQEEHEMLVRQLAQERRSHARCIYWVDPSPPPASPEE